MKKKEKKTTFVPKFSQILHLDSYLLPLTYVDYTNTTKFE